MSEVTSSMDSWRFAGFKVYASFCITRSISFKNLRERRAEPKLCILKFFILQLFYCYTFPVIYGRLTFILRLG